MEGTLHQFFEGSDAAMTPEQEDALTNFMALTQSDAETATHLLEVTHGLAQLTNHLPIFLTRPLVDARARNSPRSNPLNHCAPCARAIRRRYAVTKMGEATQPR